MRTYIFNLEKGRCCRNEEIVILLGDHLYYAAMFRIRRLAADNAWFDWEEHSDGL